MPFAALEVPEQDSDRSAPSAESTQMLVTSIASDACECTGGWSKLLRSGHSLMKNPSYSALNPRIHCRLASERLLIALS